ncbi:MAG: glycosyltransferase family 2 protein [Actinomycetales bacterium]|nr:glycosyltransferase family 2 protein [Actinomycetales bacterium]
MSINGRVSVIVPTRNNERTIEACLQSVLAQDYPDFELLVVDNSSSDGTAEIAQKLAHKFFTAGPERSAQRNRGILESAGEWILWLDSDMILPPNSVSLAVQTANEQGVIGVALPERTIGSGFWTACRALERECYLNAPWLHNPRLLNRDFMLSDGAFDEAMSGPEDTDLRFSMREAGLPIALADIVIDHDEGHLTLKEIMEKRYYYGLSIPVLQQEHDAAISTQRSEVLKAYTQNWKHLARRPVHAAGMVFMRVLEAAGYLIGARAGAKRLSQVEQGQ